MAPTTSVSKPRRRAARRDPVSISATLFGGLFESPVEFGTADLSPEGMFLQSDLLLEPDERVLVEFTVPGTRHRILVGARVARAIRGDRAGMGLAFDRMSGVDEVVLRSALERRRLATAPDPRSDGAFRA